MNRDITILIADRNLHVRKYLQREMTAAGYQVKLAENGRDVIKWAYQREPLDLIILDPDLCDADESRVVYHLLNRVPALPVVVHTYALEFRDAFQNVNGFYFVEKRGSSVERLKEVIHRTLVEPSSVAQKFENVPDVGRE